jgi:hypothetical protein
MPKRVLPLTDKQVENAKPDPAKRMTTLFDGGGLYLGAFLPGRRPQSGNHQTLAHEVQARRRGATADLGHTLDIEETGRGATLRKAKFISAYWRTAHDALGRS